MLVPPLASSALVAGTAIAPGSVAELSAVVAELTGHGQALFSEGNGTKRQIGPAVAEGARRLTLRQLDKITAYDPADMVVSAEAGVRLVELQRVLGQHGQWLPLDPPHANATLGGILATGSTGPRRYGYGSLRDHLLGVRVVGAGGVVTKSGGRVVKNVSGFDLHRLQIGAFGSLGVIAEVHLKVSPVPVARAAFVFPAASFAAAIALLLQVTATHLRPVALEALDAGRVASLRGHGVDLPGTSAVAIVGCEGTASVIERHRRELGALFPGAGAEVLEGAAASKLWQTFRDASPAVDDRILVRVGARPHALSPLLDAVEAAGFDIAARSAHAGSGIAHLLLGRTPDLAALAGRLATCAGRAQAEGGYLVVEAAPLGIAGREVLPFAARPAELGRRLKAAWDPAGLFNPGRMPL